MGQQGVKECVMRERLGRRAKDQEKVGERKQSKGK